MNKKEIIELMKLEKTKSKLRDSKILYICLCASYMLLGIYTIFQAFRVISYGQAIHTYVGCGLLLLAGIMICFSNNFGTDASIYRIKEELLELKEDIKNGTRQKN